MSRIVAVAFMSALFVLSSGAEPAKAYPPADSGYQDYAEMVTTIEQIAASKPSIARDFSIGRTHQGRELSAAKVSDNVGTDEDEPEIVFDGGMHGREHIADDRTTVGDAEWPPERLRLGESSLGTDGDGVQTERRETGM